MPINRAPKSLRAGWGTRYVTSARWELFVHREIKDVLITSREDTLKVVYDGEPDHPKWAATLHAAGFPTPTFSETTGPLTDDASGAAA